MTALRPDGFPFFELDSNLRRWNIYELPPLRLQMHFHAAYFRIDLREMSKLAQIKVGAQFAIGSR